MTEEVGAGTKHAMMPVLLPKIYLEDPESHPLTLSLASANSSASAVDKDRLNDIEVGTAITMLIHTYMKSRDEHGMNRTGKVQQPLRIAYKIDTDHASEFQGLCAESYSSSVSQSDATGGHDNGDPIYTLYLSDFWQSSASVNDILWPPKFSVLPQRIITSGADNGPQYVHPIRPTKPAQGAILYQRFIPSLMTTLTLKVASLSDNLSDFNAWQNSDRVAAFWNERGDEEHHATYLRRQLEDAHVVPVIAYFDTVAFAYFELYWVAEDHVSPFAAPVDGYDRGWHALVGNERFRGPDRVAAWVGSVTHYLFLADPRTNRVLLEPRVDNAKFIAYLQRSGYVVEREFNFPHKRAALVSVTRERFFETHSGPST